MMRLAGAPAPVHDCARIGGCVGGAWCDYCGAELLPTPARVRRTVRTVADRVMQRSR